MLFDTPRTTINGEGEMQDEMDFVFDSWGNSYRKSPWAGCVPNHLWDQVSRISEQEIVARSGCKVTVAVTPVDGREAEYPDVRRVMGYAVYEPAKRVLHFLYVKQDYRGNGIGKALLNEMLATAPRLNKKWEYTHKTNACDQFLGRRFTFNAVPARIKSA